MNDDYPENAFFNVGTIDDVKRAAEKMKASVKIERQAFLMSDMYNLRIIAADRVFYEGPCLSLIVPAFDGEKEVLAHHEAMVIAVTDGEMRYKTEDGTWHIGYVGRGFVQIANNRVILLTEVQKNRKKSTFAVPKKPKKGSGTAASETEYSGILPFQRFTGQSHGSFENIKTDSRQDPYLTGGCLFNSYIHFLCIIHVLSLQQSQKKGL